METIYIVMLIVLFGLSITGLIVGVSNDAVNFLTSAFGSKVASIRTIFTVASLGVLIGAVFSSGMMVIPRSGIFNPGMFNFNDVMVIFTAVILANILLLDFLNSLGLPTSTTVTIIFELLGAAVCMALIKIYYLDIHLHTVMDYLHTSKVAEIVVAILLSVFLAFTLGTIVQYLTRLIVTFQFDSKIKYFGAIFGGISLTALTYFIILNGLSSVSFVPESLINYIQNQVLLVIVGLFVFWTLISQFLMSLFKADILKIIILVGTFALALAYAGNDLVNFIGVPLAAKDAFVLWYDSFSVTAIAPTDFTMNGLLNDPPETSSIYLLIAGIIMVLTLWFSKKARTVIETGVNLSRQGDGNEKYEANGLSRIIVRYSIVAINAGSFLLPKKIKDKIDRQFQKPNDLLNDKRIDAPAFDKIRASINLVVAAILISVGTNLRLPLSTTYVTFMVAMGTSLSDRAWDRESAVYRVAGVLKVVGGWFSTAVIAFLGAVVFTALFWFGGLTVILLCSAFAVGMVVRSAILHSKKLKAEKQNKRFNKQDIKTINEITQETSKNISSVIKAVNKRYGKVVNHLGYHDLAKLKKDTKKLKKIETEVEALKDNVFYLIKSMDESSVEASKFYILFLDHLDSMVESLSEIVNQSYKHVNNNHKNLKFNQIRDLKKMSREMTLLFEEVITIFETRDFGRLDDIINSKSFLLEDVSELIQKQIVRIRTSDSSRKNTKLYFGLLLETKDLITSTMDLLNQFKDYYYEARTQL